MTRTLGADDGPSVEPGHPAATPVRVALLSTSDTDLLCAHPSRWVWRPRLRTLVLRSPEGGLWFAA